MGVIFNGWSVQWPEDRSVCSGLWTTKDRTNASTEGGLRRQNLFNRFVMKQPSERRFCRVNLKIKCMPVKCIKKYNKNIYIFIPCCNHKIIYQFIFNRVHFISSNLLIYFTCVNIMCVNKSVNIMNPWERQWKLIITCGFKTNGITAAATAV